MSRCAHAIPRGVTFARPTPEDHDAAARYRGHVEQQRRAELARARHWRKARLALDTEAELRDAILSYEHERFGLPRADLEAGASSRFGPMTRDALEETLLDREADSYVAHAGTRAYTEVIIACTARGPDGEPLFASIPVFLNLSPKERTDWWLFYLELPNNIEAV